jgi:hypothetical protein
MSSGLPGGPRVPGGFGTVGLRPQQQDTSPPVERMAAALQRLADQLCNPPTHVIKRFQLDANEQDTIQSNQNRVNTLTVTVITGTLDLFYGDQQGNQSPVPDERFYQNTTTQLKIPPNQWTMTVCAGNALAASGTVKLSWTN